jgi:DNA replication and repair protein RecF
MFIKDLSAVNFKNLGEIELQFSPRLNCFIGNNGAGKTNLLDAVYYLSFCKSFFNPSDQMNVKHGEGFFMLKGRYHRLDSEEMISCGFQIGSKKLFRRNEKVYSRLSDHIGLFPLVMVSPSDTVLIEGGSEERRKFIDSVISQYDHTYLSHLIQYNRILLQRNNLLKQFSSDKKFDHDLLGVWDIQLLGLGNKIHEKRKEFIERLIPVFQRYYSDISKGSEEVGLAHQSDLYEPAFEENFQASVKRDLALQFTTLGIHKDDLILNLGNYPIKKIGSQGQKKTYLVSLKLAQYEFLKNISGLKPILLLDDIFDKLDAERVSAIVKLAADDYFGQIFISDTNREHLDGIIRSVDADFRIFKILNGSVIQE